LTDEYHGYDKATDDDEKYDDPYDDKFWSFKLLERGAACIATSCAAPLSARLRGSLCILANTLVNVFLQPEATAVVEFEFAGVAAAAVVFASLWAVTCLFDVWFTWILDLLFQNVDVKAKKNDHEHAEGSHKPSAQTDLIKDVVRCDIFLEPAVAGDAT
jgi:hypothetical protein